MTINMIDGRVIGTVELQAKRARRDVTSGRLFAAMRRWTEIESGRFILWAPVLMICGVAIYFSLPTEPQLNWILAALCLPGVVWGWASRKGVAGLSLVSRILFFILLGLVLTTIRTASVSAPVLPRAVGPVAVTGVLLEREDRVGDLRLTIAPETIGAMRQDQIPDKIRVTWRGERVPVLPGDQVRVFGQLMPPPGPALPGGFDYGRQLYFDRIGAVGYLYAPPDVTATVGRHTVSVRIENLRNRIADRIMRLTPGPGAPIAAALVTGQRDGIPPDVTDDLRDTGLAHLLAISGLHMGLVCGLLFFSLRFLFACHPVWATKYPIRKWAAISAILGGAVYLTISGAPVSAQRAYIMALIGFIAILFDRRAISLRNVALAAMLIITLSPEAVMGAGFQMSFSAVTALVAAYEFIRSRKWETREQTFSAKMIRFFGALFTTSLVAGLATSPMSIFHFNRIAAFGMGANMVVMPLFTLIVMPVAVVGLVLMPTGLDVFVWPIVGWALGIIIHTTDWVASQRGALIGIPQWSDLSWGLVMSGMLILCLFKANWRWSGGGIIAIGLVFAFSSPHPVLMIAEDMKNIGAVGDDGTLRIASRRGARFTVNQWREGLAIHPEMTDLETFTCEENRCPVPVTGLMAVYTEDIEVAASACRHADIVILKQWEAIGLKASCQAELFTLERIEMTGPVFFFRSGGSYVIREGKSLRGHRPWSP